MAVLPFNSSLDEKLHCSPGLTKPRAHNPHPQNHVSSNTQTHSLARSPARSVLFHFHFNSCNKNSRISSNKFLSTLLSMKLKSIKLHFYLFYNIRKDKNQIKLKFLVVLYFVAEMKDGRGCRVLYYFHSYICLDFCDNCASSIVPHGIGVYV